jgi:heme exporter protein D
MDAVRDYFAMGGYAAFVWPAYALAFVTLAAMLIGSWKHLRASERQLAKAAPRRERAKAGS